MSSINTEMLSEGLQRSPKQSFSAFLATTDAMWYNSRQRSITDHGEGDRPDIEIRERFGTNVTMNEIKCKTIKRVTAGDGGEAWLILGSEKTAMFDCGMAYCAPEMVENTIRELNGRALDYAIITHTHYDHVGGLPYLRRQWPNLVSLGAAYGKRILEKQSAKKRICEMAMNAYRKYKGTENPDILMDGLTIDKIIGDHDIIKLGIENLTVLETPGHTNCSLSFVLNPDSIIFPSETIGVLTDRKTMTSPILKSYEDAMNSIEKCRKIGAKQIVSPHYGQVPEELTDSYWDLAVKSAEESRDCILTLHRQGLDGNDLIAAYAKKYWVGSTANQQPKEAFMINAVSMIEVILREFACIS